MQHSFTIGSDEFSQIFNDLGSLVAFYDVDFNYLFLNDYFADIMGINAQECVGKNIKEVHEHDFFPDLDKVVQEMRKGRSATIDGIFKSHDGFDIYALGVARPILDDKENIQGFSLSATDISALKNTFSALNSQIKKSLVFEQAIQASHSGIVVLRNEKGYPVTFVNDAFTQMTGYTSEEMVGKACNILQGEETSPDTLKYTKQCFKEGKAFDVEILNYKKNGEEFWNSLQTSPVKDSKGNVISFISIQRDVTEEKKMRKQVAHMEKMQALGKMASSTAHEIRNFLQPVLLMAEVLADKNQYKEHERQFEILIKNVKSAVTIINEMLIFAREKRIKNEKISLEKLSNIINEFTSTRPKRIKIDKKGLFTEENVQKNGNIVFIDANTDGLNQILSNVIANSYHAMENEGVLTIDLKKDQMSYLLSISDTGCGMDEETLEQIFDPFFTTKPLGEGTGLGMSMVKGIVEEMGASIGVESKINKGTTFRLSFPTTD